MRSPVSWTVPAVLGAAIAMSAVACTGSIGGDDGDSLVPPGTDPGRVTLHRMNRAEYDNTVRDLLGTSLAPGQDFPADDFSFGFDNMADTLSMSPVQFELYEIAAQTLIDEAMLSSVASSTQRIEAETVGGSSGGVSGGAWNLSSNGEIDVSQNFAAAGDYKVRVRAWQTKAGPDDAHMTLHVGAQSFGFDVAAVQAAPAIIEQLVTVPEGSAVVSVSFDNDYYDADSGADRNLLVDYVEIEGPIGATTSNPERDRIVTCDFDTEGTACARQIVGDFAERAWRRPVEDGDLDKLMSLVDVSTGQGDTVENGIRLALRAALVSPRFIYRFELDEDPTSEKPHELDDFELASRLSYFLWSSMPDDELFDLARAGQLHDDATLDAQVERMLADPKSQAIIDNYGGQWLRTRVLADHQADYTLFPKYDEVLASSMKQEADLFFDEILKSDTLGIDQMLETNFTYVNDDLAALYGMDPVGSSEMVRVEVDNGQRGGILRQGSLLTVTSNPDRTSPVKRGKWILTNILCDSPPDPPANVPPVQKADLEGKSVREVFEAHRADPVCASCHVVMDQLGFSLENYDAIGAYRTVDNGFDIDSTGELPDGQTFDNANEMADIIAKDPRFSRCTVKKIYTYSIGRGPGDADDYFIDDIDKAFKTKGLKMKELLKLIVKSAPFRTRHGEKGGAP